jgi:hypothetical protein
MTQQPHALKTTRELTIQGIERAGEKVRDLREGLRDASADAQMQMGRYAKRTRRYVSARPVTSTLIAVAVAAAVTALTLAVLRNERR